MGYMQKMTREFEFSISSHAILNQIIKMLVKKGYVKDDSIKIKLLKIHANF